MADGCGTDRKTKMGEYKSRWCFLLRARSPDSQLQLKRSPARKRERGSTLIASCRAGLSSRAKAFTYYITHNPFVFRSALKCARRPALKRPRHPAWRSGSVRLPLPALRATSPEGGGNRAACGNTQNPTAPALHLVTFKNLSAPANVIRRGQTDAEFALAP